MIADANYRRCARPGAALRRVLLCGFFFSSGIRWVYALPAKSNSDHYEIQRKPVSAAVFKRFESMLTEIPETRHETSNVLGGWTSIDYAAWDQEKHMWEIQHVVRHDDRWNSIVRAQSTSHWSIIKTKFLIGLYTKFPRVAAISISPSDVLSLLLIIFGSALILMLWFVIPVWAIIDIWKDPAMTPARRLGWRAAIFLSWSLGSGVYGSVTSRSRRLRIASRITLVCFSAFVVILLRLYVVS